MSSATPALIAAAAGVGLGHAILPDHWVPLAVVGRTQRYSLARVARLSGLAGVAHVLVSLVLGGIIVAVGLQLRSSVESAQNTIVGSVLLATGVGFILFELSGRGHGHSHLPLARSRSRPRPRPRPRPRSPGKAPRPSGGHGPVRTAASPDLTILPVFLAATAAGTATAVGSLIAFAAVTITTIVGLTLLATVGGYQLRGKWLERWGNVITAAVLLVIGTLVLTGTI